MAATLTDVQEAIEQLAVRRDQDTDAARSFSFASTRDPETETDDDAGDDADGQGWHKDARKALAERAQKENARKLREEEAANGFSSPHRQSLSSPPIPVELSDESDADDEDEDAIRNRHRDIHPHHHKYSSSTATTLPHEISLNDPPVSEVLQPAIPLPTPFLANRSSQSSLPTPTSSSFPQEQSVEVAVVNPSAIAQPKPLTPTTATTARFQPSIAPPSHLANITTSLPSPAMSSVGASAQAVNVPLPKSPSPVVTNGHSVIAIPQGYPMPQMVSQSASQAISQPQIVQQPTPETDPMTPPPQPSELGGGSTQESIRDSLRRAHPSDWSMEQVVEWLKSKNVDETTCAKFIGEPSAAVARDIF